jgi:hypothetical protein
VELIYIYGADTDNIPFGPGLIKIYGYRNTPLSVEMAPNIGEATLRNA